ncbi:MAG: SDR family NAD(P)-dependent oxidoreductase [Alphaproteobacteria bacterium]|nr:SDR family NAD(P)-dependent oxidoreductase [Alphaproteobacteria bacterium]
MSGRLEGRIAVITGASRGIGAAVAKRFAAEGATVVLLARTQAALEEVDDEIRKATGREAVLVPVDLRQFDKIDHIGAALFERFGRLDVLVGNAGALGGLSPLGHTLPKLWDEVMAVNVTANYRLVRIFDPMLRQSDAGRAIFVTSGAARGIHPYWGPYAASKAALEQMILCWAGEMTKTNVRINLIDPGICRTRMRVQAFPGEPVEKQTPPEAITDAFVELAAADCTRHAEIVQAQ